MMSIFMSTIMLSGCISEAIEDSVSDDVSEPEEYVWEDDGELVIVTYDVYGLTDEMLSEFENQTGYDINLMKLDDAGSVLNHLMQHKGVQIADLAIGLDNTYLQTAIDNQLLWEHFANISNIKSEALAPYNLSLIHI